jgi:hypothetical protein
MIQNQSANGNNIKTLQGGRDAIDNSTTTIINGNQMSQAQDTETIMALITHISSNAELKDGDLESIMPDPEEKIFNRFSEYCDEIKNEVIESAFYATAQKEAERVIGLDKISIGKITAYLKRESRRMLRENNGNPMTALDKLTDFFEEILKKKKDSHFERNAIRYYLIGEIPKCNIFPNN